MDTVIPELTIFEGPPGCGQGQLAARVLSALPSGWILHHGPYAEDGPARLLDRYLKPLLSTNSPTSTLLYDRSWISEAVFAPYTTDADRLRIAGHRYLERVALSRRGVVVVPFTPLSVCQLNRPPVSPEANIVAIRAHKLYQQLGETTSLPVVHCSAEAKVENLLDELERIRPAANQGPGIGHWLPGQVTLLVGEQPSHANVPELPYIDIELRREGISAWLVEQLEEHGIRESVLYWISARNPLTWTDPSFLEQLSPQRVVALGEEAAQWCGTIARVQHRAVPHPNHWRRFHHLEPYPLIKILKGETDEQRQDQA